jgi:hypothetical protein
MIFLALLKSAHTWSREPGEKLSSGVLSGHRSFFSVAKLQHPAQKMRMPDSLTRNPARICHTVDRRHATETSLIGPSHHPGWGLHFLTMSGQ